MMYDMFSLATISLLRKQFLEIHSQLTIHLSLESMMFATMRKFLFSLISAAVFLFSCAQPRKIHKGWAFSKQSIPGIERKNINGQPVYTPGETLHFIYLETKGKNKPVVDSVFLNGRLMSAGVYPVGSDRSKVGIRKEDGRPLILQPDTGNSLWRIELTAFPKETIDEKSTEKIRIKGKIGGKPFVFSTDREILLEPDVRG
jgi:hypothetical protein